MPDRLEERVNDDLAGQIRPCTHPTCHDDDGNPRLTTLGMCNGCYHHYEKALEGIVRDYWFLRAHVPSPITSIAGVRRGSGTLSHTAEWAADQSSQIARILRDAELDVRVYTHEEIRLAPMTETVKVLKAARYLTPRMDALCRMDHARATAQGIIRKHSEILLALGVTHTVERSEWPCPYCNGLTLVREPAEIRCESCHRRWDEASMGVLRRHSFAVMLASRTKGGASR
jgi:ribosomal protein L37AE/L43A